MRDAVAVGHLQPVVGRVRDGQHADPDAFVLVLEADPLVGVHDGHRLGQRAEHPDRHAALVRVRAEDAVRVAVLAGDQLGQDAAVEGQWGAQGGAHRDAS